MLVLLSILFVVIFLVIYFHKARLKAGSSQNCGHILGLDHPSILFGKILHIRHFPAVHSFRYSFPLVGVPVNSEGTRSSIISVDAGPLSKRGWLQVKAAHHLGRGNNENGLRAKLDLYLQSQNMNPSTYGKVYLVTTPQLLGHHFTPASFWYLYSKTGKLKTVLAEVNNTFDERRVYVLENQLDCDVGGALPQSRSEWFRSGSFQKDFHVSPFSSRKGAYTVSTRNPFPELGTNTSNRPKSDIDIKVTLYSSKGHAKVYARTWCDATDMIDPEKMPMWEFLRLLLLWSVLDRITYGRIVLQAIKLSWVRKLQMWYRPEPRTTAVPRSATNAERTLSCVFHEYLVQLGRITGRYTVVSTVASGDGYIAKYILRTKRPESNLDFELNIHTPAFYSFMVGQHSFLEFMKAALMDVIAENRTASCNQGLDELLDLLESASCEANLEADSIEVQGPLTSVFSQISRILPCKKAPAAYSQGDPKSRTQLAPRSVEANDSQSGVFLLPFVLGACNARLQWQFYTALLRVLGWRLLVRLSGGSLAWGA